MMRMNKRLFIMSTFYYIIISKMSYRHERLRMVKNGEKKEQQMADNVNIVSVLRSFCNASVRVLYTSHVIDIYESRMF